MCPYTPTWVNSRIIFSPTIYSISYIEPIWVVYDGYHVWNHCQNTHGLLFVSYYAQFGLIWANMSKPPSGISVDYRPPPYFYKMCCSKNKMCLKMLVWPTLSIFTSSSVSVWRPVPLSWPWGWCLSVCSFTPQSGLPAVPSRSHMTVSVSTQLMVDYNKNPLKQIYTVSVRIVDWLSEAYVNERHLDGLFQGLPHVLCCHSVVLFHKHNTGLL